MVDVETIRSSNEIVRVLQTGRRYRCRYATAFILGLDEKRGAKSRVAYIAAKRRGNAVWRNRSKRVLRVAWRQCCQNGLPNELLFGNDILLVANGQTAQASSLDIADELLRTLYPSGRAERKLI